MNILNMCYNVFYVPLSEFVFSDIWRFTNKNYYYLVKTEKPCEKQLYIYIQGNYSTSLDFFKLAFCGCIDDIFWLLSLRRID